MSPSTLPWHWDWKQKDLHSQGWTECSVLSGWLCNRMFGKHVFHLLQEIQCPGASSSMWESGDNRWALPWTLWEAQAQPDTLCCCWQAWHKTRLPVLFWEELTRAAFCWCHMVSYGVNTLHTIYCLFSFRVGIEKAAILTSFQPLPKCRTHQTELRPSWISV